MRAMGMAPAWRRRATSVASAVEGAAFLRPNVPAVQRVPACSMESLTLNGTPCSGPRRVPAANSRSAAAASSSARSWSTSTAAFSAGFTAAICCRWAAISSREEIRRSRTRRACSRAERVRMWVKYHSRSSPAGDEMLAYCQIECTEKFAGSCGRRYWPRWAAQAGWFCDKVRTTRACGSIAIWARRSTRIPPLTTRPWRS